MIKWNKRAQLTIFIIIAIVVVGGLVSYFLLRDKIFVEQIPQNMRPVYDYYLSVRDGSVRLLLVFLCVLCVLFFFCLLCSSPVLCVSS